MGDYFEKEGFKIDKKSLYFKRLFRQLKENLIEVKHRTIQRKRDLILGERKSEWHLVDDLMEELKHEKVKQVINSIPESELEKESPLLSQVRVSFIDSRKQMGLVEKTISEYGYYLDEMMEIIDDKPIQEVTHSDGRSYVDILGQLPVNKEKDPKYRDKTISEILKMKG